MSPFLEPVPQPEAHVCKPPTHWPRISRRRHPAGTVWECDTLVIRPSDAAEGYCGRRWVITAWMYGWPQWSSWREVA